MPVGGFDDGGLQLWKAQIAEGITKSAEVIDIVYFAGYSVHHAERNLLGYKFNSNIADVINKIKKAMIEASRPYDMDDTTIRRTEGLISIFMVGVGNVPTYIFRNDVEVLEEELVAQIKDLASLDQVQL